MIPNNNHIVLKEIVEMDVPNEHFAQLIQESTSRICSEQLPALLDEAFTELNLNGDTLKIDSLTIDLSEIPLENWEETFLLRIKQEVLQQLLKRKELLEQKSQNMLFSSDPSSEVFLSKPIALCQSFLEFVANGTTNNPEIFSNPTEFELSIVEALEKSDDTRKYIQNGLQQILKQNLFALTRLYAQFSIAFTEKLTEYVWYLLPQEWKLLKVDLQTLIQKHSIKITQEESNAIFYAAALSNLIDFDSPVDLEKLSIKCIAQWENDLLALKPNLNVKLKNNDINDSVSNSNINLGIKDKVSNKTKLSSDNNTEVASQDYPQTEENVPFKKYYIENAGLILIAPFFPMFFERLGYLKEKEFINSDTQERAVHLLQYLATGKEKCTENFLILNKFLCGWPLNQPLKRNIEFTQAEKEEAESLLQSVIKNWGSLGNSSIEALQQTFLVRNGILFKQNDSSNWQLQVERKEGIDILIERLPWTISIIKCAWMPDSLNTVWV